MAKINTNTISDAQMAALRKRAAQANADALSDAAVRRRKIAAAQQAKADQS